jgi:hypothetical protein
VSAKPRHKTNDKVNDEANEDSGENESEEFFLASQQIKASDDEANSAAGGNERIITQLAKNTMLCDNKSDETTVESLLY